MGLTRVRVFVRVCVCGPLLLAMAPFSLLSFPSFSLSSPWVSPAAPAGAQAAQAQGAQTLNCRQGAHAPHLQFAPQQWLLEQQRG